MEVGPVLHPPGTGLDLHQGDGRLVLRRCADGQVDPGRQPDGTPGQSDPHRLLRAGEPRRLQPRPPPVQPSDLPLELGAELDPVGPRQSVDP